MFTPPDVVFHPGLIVNESFTDYKEFQRGAKNHLILTRYRLGSGPFYGVHDGIQLFGMQFGHADRHEGVISDGVTPKDCLTMGVIQRADGTACVDRVPLREGDMIVVDDRAPYRFASGRRVRMTIVSIHKSLFKAHRLPIPDTFPVVFHDKNASFSSLIDRLWSEVTSWKPGEAAPERLHAMDDEVIRGVAEALESPRLPEPVHGIGFDARDYLLDSLDEVGTVEALAARFNVSYRTLETSFRTLFGMTPKQLMDILRLNRAHEALCRADANETSVTDVAMHWGFKHLGRFARRHKAMFDTYPKEALLSEPFKTLPS